MPGTKEPYRSSSKINMQALAKEMHENIENSEIQANGCNLLRGHLYSRKRVPPRKTQRKAQNDATIRKMLDAGCINAVFCALEVHKNLPSVQIAGCTVLATATLVESGVRAGDEKLRIPILLRSLRLVSDGTIMALYLQALAALSKRNEELLDEIIANGPMRIVLEAMRGYRQSKCVQFAGVDLILHLVAREGPALEFVQSKGLDLLLTAMSGRMSTYGELADMAFSAFLALKKWADLGESCKPFAAHILQEMETCSDVESCQMCGCCLIRELCAASNGISLVGCRGVDLVVRAMRRFKQSRDVQSFGCSALTVLCTDSPTAWYVMSKGGCQAVLNVMERFKKNKKLCKLACEVLLVITKKEIMVDTAKCIDAVCTAMTTHKMSEGLQRDCAIILSCFARHDEQHPRLFTAVCAECLLLALDTFKYNCIIQQYAMFAAGHIATVMRLKDRQTMQRVFGSKAIDCALEALKIHKGHEMVEAIAFNMLTYLAAEPANVDHILRRDALKTILDIGEKHRAVIGHFLVGIIHSFSERNVETCQLLGKLGAIQMIYKARDKCERVFGPDMFFRDALANLRNAGPENCAIIDACERRRIDRLLRTVCVMCGKNASEAGRELLIKCELCTIAPTYCSVQCKYANSARHMQECKANSKVCVVCGKYANQVGREALFKCAACTIAPMYCSVECQRVDWKEHKKICRQHPRQREGRD